MTIKTHIAISATISLALIAIIACQQKTQAPKEQSKAVSEHKTKVEEVMKNFEQEVKAETEKLETKVNEVTQEVKEEVKEIESKVDEAVTAPSLFANTDFGNGLDNWEHDKDVNIIQENDKNIVELIGSQNDQTRIWQRISMISGHVYRLSFELKADQGGALAIFRDNSKGEESYLFTGESKEWKTFKKDFKSYKNGQYMIFLSCKAEGKFYYSNASLTDITKE